MTAERRGRSVFAVRITSLHMKLVSYTRSVKPFSPLPREELFVQALDSSALSNAASSDLPPASFLPASPPSSVQKAVAQMNLHTPHATSTWSCYTSTPICFSLDQPICSFCFPKKAKSNESPGSLGGMAKHCPGKDIWLVLP